MASYHDASFYCITKDELPVNGKRLAYVSVSIISAVFGLVGATIQIVSFFRKTNGFLWKQKRSRRRSPIQLNPSIVLLMAVMNLTSCIGVIVRSVSLQVVKPPIDVTDGTTNLQSPQISNGLKAAGAVLEGTTQFSFIASVMWTLSFAVDIFLQLRGKQISMKWFHVVSWSVSTLCTVACTVIVFAGSDRLKYCSGNDRLTWRYAVAYSPMLFTFVTCCILYWKSGRKMSEMFTKYTATLSHTERAIIRRLRIRFFWIVFAFGLCWFPNILDSIIQLVLLKTHPIYEIIYPLWIMEATFNPLQGFFNCFLYGYRCKPCAYNGRLQRHNDVIIGDDRRLYTPIKNHFVSYT